MVSSIGFNLGIGSGLDIKSLIDGLANAERAPKDALIKAREEANSAKVSALADAAAAIDSFAAALTGLVNGGTLSSQPSVSDATILSASTVSGKQLASLASEIEVVQLARTQTLASAALASASDPVGQGTLTIAVGGSSFDVVIDASNDSLTGLAAAVNASGSGVTASIVTDAGTARLVLKGKSGADNSFTLSVPGGTASGLERFAYDPLVAGGMTLAQAAQDAVLRVDGVEISRASNSFSDVVEGVKIDLKRAVPGSLVSLGVTRPTAAIEQAVEDFVLAYNELSKSLAASTAAGTGSDGAGALRGDLSIREMQRRLAAIPSTVLNSSGSFKTLAEIGVGTNRDGTLSVNKTRLKSSLASDPLSVEALFTSRQVSSSALVEITSSLGAVKSGTYALTNLVPGNGVDPATGNFDGFAGIGTTASSLRAPFGSPAAGLVVLVRGAVASASVTVEPGLGGALQEIRDYLRASTGPIAKSQQSLAAEAKAIAADKAAVELRAQKRYDQLTATFTAMERQVSAFKATQSYLDQQIKMWTGGND